MERGPGVAHQILKHGPVGKPDGIAFQDPFDHKALDLFMKATTIR